MEPPGLLDGDGARLGRPVSATAVSPPLGMGPQAHAASRPRSSLAHAGITWLLHVPAQPAVCLHRGENLERACPGRGLPASHLAPCAVRLPDVRRGSTTSVPSCGHGARCPRVFASPKVKLWGAAVPGHPGMETAWAGVPSALKEPLLCPFLCLCLGRARCWVVFFTAQSMRAMPRVSLQALAGCYP